MPPLALAASSAAFVLCQYESVLTRGAGLLKSPIVMTVIGDLSAAAPDAGLVAPADDVAAGALAVDVELLLLLPQALSARDATITAVMPKAPMLLVRPRGLKACNVSLLQWNDYDL